MSLPNQPSEYTSYGPPEITIKQQPMDTIGRIGAYLNFPVIVEANDPLYQWYDTNGKAMPRMCKSILAIGPIKEEDFGFYQLRIWEKYTGKTASTRWVELKRAKPRNTQSDLNTNQQVEPNVPPQPFPVQARKEYSSCQTQQLTPVLLTQPEGGAYSRGSNITLTAHFENATHYQWYKDGVKLEGCVGNTLAITNAKLGNTGDYTIYAMNSSGTSHMKTRVDIM